MQSAGKQSRILIVDDELELRQTLKVFAETAGHQVVVAENGRRALELIASEPFDVVVSDIGMPVLTGTQLLEKLNAYGYRIPVLLISAYGHRNLILGALDAGAFDFLEKPFRSSDFTAILAEAARVSRELQNNGLAEPRLSLPTHELSSGSIVSDAREADVVVRSLRSNSADLPKYSPNSSNGSDLSEANQVRAQLVAEVLSVTRQAERALSAIKHSEDSAWEMGYLFRAFRMMSENFAAMGEGELAAIARMLQDGVALFRIRRSLLSNKTLGLLRKATKMIGIAAQAPRAELSGGSELAQKLQHLKSEVQSTIEKRVV